MKTAKKKVTSYELNCPTCEETLPSPGGSLYWDVNEIHSGTVITCPFCSTKCKLPKT